MALKTSIKVTGTSEAAQALAAVQKAFAPDLVQDAILPAAVIVRDEARRRAPLGKGLTPDGRRRDHLRHSIYASKGKRGVLSVIAGVNLKRVPHAHLVEFGTEAHLISPKKRKWLTLSGWRRLPFVRHPGAEKKPYFRPAVRATKDRVLKAVEIGCKKLLLRGITTSGSKALSGRD